MKKRLLLVMLASMFAFSSLTLVGCGEKEDDDKESSKDKDDKKSKKDKDSDDEDDDDDKDSKKSKKDKDEDKDDDKSSKKDKKDKKDDDEDDVVIDDDGDDTATVSGYTLENYIDDNGLGEDIASYFNDESDDSFYCDVYYFDNSLFVDMYFDDSEISKAEREQMADVLSAVFEDESYSDMMISYLDTMRDSGNIDGSITLDLNIFFQSDTSNCIYEVSYTN